VTYYDRPLLKEPVWEWMVPAYYYVGGLTGASLALGAAAQLGDARARIALIRRCHWIGFVGCSVSGVLLIWDLGRPERFFHMLRVFRPTSPMNMGVWILTASGGAAAGALLRGGGVLGYFAGLCGAALATYTGVLVSNSAVPVWQQARRVLPILFGFSAMASSGSAFRLLVQSSEEHRISGLFGVAGQVAELAAAFAMERRVSIVPRVGRPLKHGRSGAMWQSATVLTAASLLITLLPGKGRKKRIVAGILGTLGSALMRFSIAALGTASARDARASFDQQRTSSLTTVN
jgi:formate-dependent nitrite reductase membrane component NrfD